MTRFGGFRGLLAAAALALLGLASLAPAAVADPTYTWSGLGTPSSATNWSNKFNWSGTPPATGATGTFVFPALTGCDPSTDACYQSNDDEWAEFSAGSNMDGLQLTGGSYDITETGDSSGSSADPYVAVGSGGITETGNTNDTLSFPINPDVAQTWTLTGTGPAGSASLDLADQIANSVTTASPFPVTVDATRGATLLLTGPADDFPLTFDGTPTDRSGTLQIGDTFEPTDTTGFNVNNATVEFGAPGNSLVSIGDLTATNAAVSVGVPGDSIGGVDVANQTFNASSSSVAFEFDRTDVVDGNGSVLDAQVGVDLSGDTLALDWGGGGHCPQFTTGEVDTLITTGPGVTGRLFGTPFTNAPDGAIVAMHCTPAPGFPQPLFRINYTGIDSSNRQPSSMTATALGGTATSLSVSPSTSTGVDQAVTLSATVTEHPVSGVMDFTEGGSSLSCSGQPVSSVTPTATCTTSFAVADSGQPIVATFVPDSVNPLAPSSSQAVDLPPITQDETTTQLSASGTTLATGAPVTYTADVYPDGEYLASIAAFPSGRVTFLDGGAPIACTGAGDNVVTTAEASFGQATCATSFVGAGRQAITAQYTGDANFAGSTSTGQTTAVTGPAPFAAITPAAAPATGSAYTIGESVSTAFYCLDRTGGPGVASCDDSNGTSTVSGGTGHLDTSTPGTHAYTVTETSLDGRTATASFSYTVAALPSASIASPAAGGVFALGESVPTQFSCRDGTDGPGLASCDDSRFTDTATGGAGHLDTSTLGAHTYTVQATSADGQSATASINYTVVVAPSASIASPAAGGVYAVGESIATRFSCGEGAGGPGLASCDDSSSTRTLAGGTGHLNTATPGAHAYTVTVTSRDGGSATATIAYTVISLKVSVRGAHLVLKRRRTTIRLACSPKLAGGACQGVVSLTLREPSGRHHGVRSKTVVLAHAGYAVAAGRSRVIVLRLTGRALRLIGHASGRRLSATASVTVTGGATARRTITVTSA